ncbi:cubilin [Trichonephila clavipes]|nr:cubilin [Trichonephila clavipes]
MQITGNHQRAWIVHQSDESVREGYIRNGGKEVKLFTSALKAFQCNNRIVMAQRKHLDDFYVVELLDDWNVDVTSWKYPRKHGIAQSVISRLWQRFQDDGNVSRCYSTGRPRVTMPNEDRYIWQLLPKETDGAQHQTCLKTVERHRYSGVGWLVWGGIILGSRTDLHVQSVTMTGHIYRDVILEQHVRLFRSAMGAEFLFMDDNARLHLTNIVDECVQSEDITRMD